MTDVLINLTVHARGDMATKLLEAAGELGLSPYVVKTTSEGFRVPREVHAHLFPSLYADPDDGEPVLTLHGDASTENDEPASSPAEDFGDLTETELEELTAPDKGE